MSYYKDVETIAKLVKYGGRCLVRDEKRKQQLLKVAKELEVDIEDQLILMNELEKPPSN